MKQTVCDRCHGQKLKCEFANGGDSCKRCTRARAKCTYPTYEERAPNHIEDQGRPTAGQSQMTNARGTTRSESLPTHPRHDSHQHRSFTVVASPRLDRPPNQAHMSRKRLRSSAEGLATSYSYPMTRASEQSLDAALSQEALAQVATAPAHDVLNVPFDFTWSDVEMLQLDGLASDSLLGPYSDGSPRYMPHLHDTSDVPVSPCSSSTPGRVTIETYKDAHCATMPAPSVSLSPTSATPEATLEDQLCRLWRDLGCSAIDRTNPSVSEAHQHTTTLINITKAFTTHPETFSPAPDLLSADDTATDQQPHAADPPNDPSIVLFILSCHTRLLRFYDRLLSLLLLEISSATSASSSEHDTPRTNATTASALSWVQTVSSIAHLAEKLGDAVRLLRRPLSGGESDGADVGEQGEFDDLVRTQGEILGRLRKGVCARVEEVRGRIRASDVV